MHTSTAFREALKTPNTRFTPYEKLFLLICDFICGSDERQTTKQREKELKPSCT